MSRTCFLTLSIVAFSLTALADDRSDVIPTRTLFYESFLSQTQLVLDSGCHHAFRTQPTQDLSIESMPEALAKIYQIFLNIDSNNAEHRRQDDQFVDTPGIFSLIRRALIVQPPSDSWIKDVLNKVAALLPQVAPNQGVQAALERISKGAGFSDPFGHLSALTLALDLAAKAAPIDGAFAQRLVDLLTIVDAIRLSTLGPDGKVKSHYLYLEANEVVEYEAKILEVLGMAKPNQNWPANLNQEIDIRLQTFSQKDLLKEPVTSVYPSTPSFPVIHTPMQHFQAIAEHALRSRR